MIKTDVVIEHLDIQNTEYLLLKVIDLVKAREFLDLLLPWLISAVDRRFDLSLNTRSMIMETLEELLQSEESSEYRLDELQVKEVSRVYSKLRKELILFGI
jgi:hypothetical protein